MMKSNDKKESWPNVITLVKDGEKYLFAYDDASRKALLGVFGTHDTPGSCFVILSSHPC